MADPDHDAESQHPDSGSAVLFCLNLVDNPIQFGQSRFIYLQDLLLLYGNSINRSLVLPEMVWVAIFLKNLTLADQGRVDNALRNRSLSRSPLLLAIQTAFSKTETRLFAAAMTKVTQQLSLHTDTDVSSISTELKAAADEGRARSLFSELPVELIRMILKDIVPVNTWVLLQPCRILAQLRGITMKGSGGVRNVHMHHVHCTSAILRLDKRFYAIGASMIYEMNTFVGDPATLSQFSQMISASNLRNIRRIGITPYNTKSGYYLADQSIQLLKDLEAAGVQLSQCLLATATRQLAGLPFESVRYRHFIRELYDAGFARWSDVPRSPAANTTITNFMTKAGRVKVANYAANPERDVLMNVYQIFGRGRLSQGM